MNLKDKMHAGMALACAMGLHLAGFAIWGGQAVGSSQSTGSGGDALLTIAPMAGSMVELVAAWEAPPSVAEVASVVIEAPIVSTAPTVPNLPQLTVPMMESPAPVALPQPERAPEVAPKIDTPPMPEPAPTPEPKAKAAPEKEQPKPDKSHKSQPAVAGQVAAGSGGGASAGDGGKAVSASGGAGQESLKAEWGATIRARVERRKSYPRGADGAEGQVKLQLTVDTRGVLVSVGVARSSGSAVLDQAAVKAVQSARFPAAPKGMKVGSYKFSLALDYKR